jgi:hypothetical protein
MQRHHHESQHVETTMKPACQRFFDLLFVAIVMMTVPVSSVTAAPQSPPGALYLGAIDGRPVVACIDHLAGEGSFYFADLPNDNEPTRSAAFKTRSLTRSKIAPENCWVEVQSGSGESAPDASEPVDESYRSWWQFSSASDLKLTATRHFRKSDSTQENADFALSRTQSDCAKFEDARLHLPWKDVVGGRVKIGDYSFQKTIHPATEVASFRLLRGPRKAVTAAINRAVKVREENFHELWVDCQDFDAQIRPFLLTNAVVTIQASDSSYCGGAHPNETSSLVIFDAKTGALIDFDQWLSPLYQGVKGALKALVAEAVVESGAEESCAERIRDIDWNAFTLWMAPDAMQFRFHEGARSLIHCKDDYAVPFNAVRRFIDAKHRIRFGQLRKRVEAQSALKEKLDAAYR